MVWLSQNLAFHGKPSWQAVALNLKTFLADLPADFTVGVSLSDQFAVGSLSLLCLTSTGIMSLVFCLLFGQAAFGMLTTPFWASASVQLHSPVSMPFLHWFMNEDSPVSKAVPQRTLRVYSVCISFWLICLFPISCFFLLGAFSSWVHWQDCSLRRVIVGLLLM